MSDATSPDDPQFKLEVLLKAARRATWDALHGPEHLRAGRFRVDDVPRAEAPPESGAAPDVSTERGVDVADACPWT